MADVTDATFNTAVLERSKTVPIVVDLWAPWCGPCKQLGPILEKVIGETGGLVELAKVNVDENPEVSTAFHVQSIPAVYAMKGGQIVDGFMGAVGEPEVVAFVQRLLDMTDEDVAEEEEVADDGTTDESGEQTETVPVGDDAEVVEGAPAAPAATAPAAEVVESVGRPEPMISEPGQPVATPPPSEAEVAAIEAELETLLTNVKTDDAARERFIALLDQLGNDHPATGGWRRRLSATLF